MNILKFTQISWFITMITCTIFRNWASLSITGPESLKNILQGFRKRERRNCCTKEGEESPFPICPSVISEAVIIGVRRKEAHIMAQIS